MSLLLTDKIYLLRSNDENSTSFTKQNHCVMFVRFTSVSFGDRVKYTWFRLKLDGNTILYRSYLLYNSKEIPIQIRITTVVSIKKGRKITDASNSKPAIGRIGKKCFFFNRKSPSKSSSRWTAGQKCCNNYYRRLVRSDRSNIEERGRYRRTGDQRYLYKNRLANIRSAVVTIYNY